MTNQQESNPAISLGSASTGRNAVAVVAGLAALAAGGFFLAVWLTTGPETTEWVGYRMKTNTALCLVCAALALLLSGRGRAGALLARVLATVTTAIGVGILFQYVTGIDLHIDQLIARDFPAAETMGFPNRMAPNTAMIFALAGPALLLLSSPDRSRAIIGQALALTVLGVCVMAAVGYLYQASVLYQPTQYMRMSPYAASGGAVLAIGLLAARTDVGIARLMLSEGPGGYLARRLIPLAGLAPMLLGWLRLQGEKKELYTTGTGTSLLVLLTMSTLPGHDRGAGPDAGSGRRAPPPRRGGGAQHQRADRGAGPRRQRGRGGRGDREVGPAGAGRALGRGHVAVRRRQVVAPGLVAGLRHPGGRRVQGRPLDRDLPVCEAMRTGQPVFLGSPEEYQRRYPELAQLRSDSRSWAALPVQGRDRVIGAITLSFAEAQPFDEQQRQRLMQLARQCGQALDRALLIDEREEVRALLETVLSVAPVGWAFLDRELRYVRVNAALAALHGLPAVEHVGRPLSEVLEPEYTRFIEANLREVLATNLPKADQPYSMAVPGKPDETRHLLISVYPVPDRSGLPVGIGKVVVDVTPEQRAREGAEAANRAKDEFLAMLGHELRNPLAPILTALQLMQLRGDERARRSERPIIERQVAAPGAPGRRSAGRLAHHPRQGRAAARAASSSAAWSPSAIEMASPLLEERRHRLVVDVPRRAGASTATRHRLAQVCRQPAHQRRQVHRRRAAASTSARRGASGEAVVLRVQRHRHGHRRRACCRGCSTCSCRARRRSTRRRAGWAWGCRIVRSLVELHGGTRRRAQRGARAGAASSRCALPRRRRERRAAAPAERRGGRRRRARRARGACWSWTTTRDAAELLAEALEHAGTRPASPTTAPAPCAWRPSSGPSWRCLDIGLPVMDGYELARRLRALRAGGRWCWWR